MSYRPLACSAFGLALTLCIASCGPKASASTSSKIAALKELRASGVITPEQYAQRVAQLRADGAGSPAPASSSTGLLAIEPGRRTHEVADLQLGAIALHVTTPASWRFQGGAAHDSGCASPPDTTRFATESPDGSAGFTFQGGYVYGMSASAQMNAQMQGQGCIVFASPSAADFLKAVWLPRERPGAQVLGMAPLPEDAPEMRQARGELAQAGLQDRYTVSGFAMKLRDTQGGRESEEMVHAVDRCVRMQAPPPIGAQMQCTVQPLVVVRAPPGQVDDLVAEGPHLLAIAEDPGYAPRLKQLIDQRSNGMIATHNATMANIQRTGGAILDRERRSQDAIDRSSQAVARSMGDNADFTAPNGQTFNASNQYSHTYVDQYGHVVQTNSAYPPGPGWTEVQGR